MNYYYLNWKPKLAENEKLLWKCGPKKVDMIDPARKTFTYGLFGVAILWIILSIPVLIEVKENFLISLLFMEIVPILMIVSPIRDGWILQKGIAYAITDCRVIVESFGEEYSMNYDANTKVERRSNNTICIGEAVKLKPSQERRVLFTHGMHDEARKCVGIVLYTTDCADSAMEELKKRFNK